MAGSNPLIDITSTGSEGWGAAMSYRLQRVLLPPGLAQPAHQGPCREFIVVQKTDNHHHHNHHHHDYDYYLHKLQFSCREDRHKKGEVVYYEVTDEHTATIVTLGKCDTCSDHRMEAQNCRSQQGRVGEKRTIGTITVLLYSFENRRSEKCIMNKT